MSDSQKTGSSGSAFRDDEDKTTVVERMYEVADQIGDDMQIGLGGNFDYQEASPAKRRV